MQFNVIILSVIIMKKNSILILILILILSLILVAYMYSKNKASVSGSIKTYGNITYETYDDINKYISDNKKTMLVIGQTGCHYCEMYTPILDSLSLEYKFNFMYIDIKKLTDGDRTMLMNSNIAIPSKCTGGEENKTLKDGFSTPLTLILENGKTYDCIRGYKEKYVVKNSLIDAKYITEKEDSK